MRLVHSAFSINDSTDDNRSPHPLRAAIGGGKYIADPTASRKTVRVAASTAPAPASSGTFTNRGPTRGRQSEEVRLAAESGWRHWKSSKGISYQCGGVASTWGIQFLISGVLVGEEAVVMLKNLA